MIFLKLGGSLITDKEKPETARHAVITRIASEIAAFLKEQPSSQLLVGHGSGSFGHTAADRYATHQGAVSPADWRGFGEVWAAAQRLNRIVLDALRGQGLPAMTFTPSASALAEDGRLVELAVAPIRRALASGLLPIVHGDVAFDQQQGASIISTEEVFRFLASELAPDRVLFAGAEAGVFADYPERSELLVEVSSANQGDLPLLGAVATDVTGGMAAKVRQSLELADLLPTAEIRIFSGQEVGAVFRCLAGEEAGTRVRSSPSD